MPVCCPDEPEPRLLARGANHVSSTGPSLSPSDVRVVVIAVMHATTSMHTSDRRSDTSRADPDAQRCLVALADGGRRRDMPMSCLFSGHHGFETCTFVDVVSKPINPHAADDADASAEVDLGVTGGWASGVPWGRPAAHSLPKACRAERNHEYGVKNGKAN